MNILKTKISRKLPLLLLASLVLSCNSKKKDDTPEETIEQANKTEVLSHADYNIIFENDTVDNVPVEEIEIGMLKVPSGKIVVTDPLVYPVAKPFVKTVPPGEYPVKIYAAKTTESGDRYAIAKLEFSENKAEKWVLALLENEDINKLKEDGFFGFPADAGLGGFFDYEAGKEFTAFNKKFREENPGLNVYDAVFAAEFKKNAKNPSDTSDYGDWVNYTIPESDLNVTMFQSGYGDGVYPAYWGIDKDGNITSLVIDFLVLLLPKVQGV